MASSFDKIDITVTANEDVPSGDTLYLLYYPTNVNSPSTLTYTVGSLSKSDTHAADLILSNTLYYLQPHTVDLINSNSSGSSVILYTENIDKLPPPQVFPRIVSGSSDQIATKTVAYDIRLENSTNSNSNTSFMQNIQNTFGLRAWFQIFITGGGNACFTENLLIGSTTCVEVGSLADLRNKMDQGKKEYYYDPYLNDPEFDDSESSFIDEQDFSDLMPSNDDDVDNYNYHNFAILREYQINTKNSGATSTYVRFEDESDRVAGHYTILALSGTATNSVSAPESLASSQSAPARAAARRYQQRPQLLGSEPALERAQRHQRLRYLRI